MEKYNNEIDKALQASRKGIVREEKALIILEEEVSTGKKRMQAKAGQTKPRNKNKCIEYIKKYAYGKVQPTQSKDMLIYS